MEEEKLYGNLRVRVGRLQGATRAMRKSIEIQRIVFHSSLRVTVGLE